ncbi:bile acid:sodium symporter [Mesorhizobium sp.]|uniref:bile acid:sodium symporter family protein n=1 Tax=Mesorhizobium sp. TaxID=1871066 RepID=UPI000FE6D5D4|nr:bile acid:sodium symporter [Mesorhizobium sp.]RWK61490.1 MAG: hypothetical protein EOR49_16710 [Mesorhizobium sp.]RWM43895.1 MAG: hypothetical protein EOR76_27450 [Mesorhizobium sp.]RWM53434.1 MAG: hypothetical protein EOR78_19430 [Mesorhizobium sp.]RWM56829.1 MAG: hypothetical protein EOR79_17320 [Mesorhizobium sp.]RWM96465.1 MAG: hypothetical protein EOR85_22715 [Mesorhizobium sp.]
MALTSLVNILVPVGLVFIMMVVGSQLTLADLKRAVGALSLIAAALASQWLMLPLVTVALILWMSPPPVVAVGMALVAVSPIASLSNFYVMLARGNLGLAVALTALSSVLALAAAPMSLVLLSSLLPEHALGVEIPAGSVLLQSLLTLVLPLAAGIAIRFHASEWVARWSAWLQRLSLITVVLVVGLIFATQVLSMPTAILIALVQLALLFTIILTIAGALTVRLFAIRFPEMVAASAGFPARNLGFATLLAVQVAGRAEFAAFAAVFFVVQLLVLLPLALTLRRLAAITQSLRHERPS